MISSLAQLGSYQQLDVPKCVSKEFIITSTKCLLKVNQKNTCSKIVRSLFFYLRYRIFTLCRHDNEYKNPISNHTKRGFLFSHLGRILRTPSMEHIHNEEILWKTKKALIIGKRQLNFLGYRIKIEGLEDVIFSDRIGNLCNWMTKQELVKTVRGSADKRC